MLMKADSRIAPPGNASPAPAAPSRSGPRGVVPTPADLEETLPLAGPARPAGEVLPMRCLQCQGPVERGTAPVRVERNGYRLAWESVPAWVCARCDLAYFEPAEVEIIQRAVKSMGRKPSEAPSLP